MYAWQWTEILENQKGIFGILLDRFAHVEYSTVEEATDAMKSMNGTEIDGRRIRVNFASGKGSGGSRRPSRHESGSDRLNSGEFSSSRSFDDGQSDSFHRGSHENSGFGAGPGAGAMPGSE